MERIPLSLRVKIKISFTSLGRSVLGKSVPEVSIRTSRLANNIYVFASAGEVLAKHISHIASTEDAGLHQTNYGRQTCERICLFASKYRLRSNGRKNRKNCVTVSLIGSTYVCLCRMTDPRFLI